LLAAHLRSLPWTKRASSDSLVSWPEGRFAVNTPVIFIVMLAGRVSNEIVLSFSVVGGNHLGNPSSNVCLLGTE